MANIVLRNMAYVVHRMNHEGMESEDELLAELADWQIGKKAPDTVAAALVADEVEINNAVDSFCAEHPFISVDKFTRDEKRLMCRVIARRCAELRGE